MSFNRLSNGITETKPGSLALALLLFANSAVFTDNLREHLGSTYAGAAVL
jgi:hypothetical protein